MCIVSLARSLRHFVSLFNDGWQQRFARLLAIPRATAGRAQLRDDFAELFKRSHSERSPFDSLRSLRVNSAESKDLVTLSLGVITGFLDFARNDRFQMRQSDRCVPNSEISPEERLLT